MATAILTQVKTDCRISAPIASLDATGTAHLTECLEIQMGGAFQCPGIAYVAGTSVDSMGKKCRDMTSAHRDMKLRNADFNAFVEDIAIVLAAKGLSQDDIRSIAPAFEGTRSGVVQENSQPDRDTYCTCTDLEYKGKPCYPEGGAPVDSGTDTGTDSGSDSGDASDSG
jgi:hypothetical protein